MWYGFVTRQRCLVTQSWPTVRNLVLAYPYASFRKFRYEEAAWDFVSRKHRAWTKSGSASIQNFGETIQELTADASFHITPDAVYCNVVLPDSLNVRVVSQEENISVSCRRDLIMICNKQLTLKADSLRDRAVAMHSLLRLLGPFVDVNILVPDMSTFFIFQYKGTKVREYVKLLELVNARSGKVGLSVMNRQYVKEM
jgi:hypothetical protein